MLTSVWQYMTYEDPTPEENLLTAMTGLPWASINHQLLVNTYESHMKVHTLVKLLVSRCQ